MIEKLCTACAEPKPISQFHKHGDGWRSQCKPCRTAKVRGWYDATRTERLAQKKTYSAQNSKRICAYLARYRVEHPDRVAAGKAAYAAKNRERIRDYLASWRQANPEKIREKSKADYWSNPEFHRAKSLAQIKKHPESVRQRRQRRRARMAGAVGAMTKEEWREILEYHDNRCAYCLERCTALTMDHVIPIVRGGDHAADNVVPACKQCNSTKRANLIFTMLTA